MRIGEAGVSASPFFLDIMFVHVHIPIIDSRGLLSSFRRFPKPVFPMPAVGSFVRNFGEVRFREHIALSSFVGEDQFFLADGALRFENLPRYNTPIGNSLYNKFCEFRRLYTLGKMMNRYELGFSFFSGSSDAESVVRHILNLPVKVKNNKAAYTPTVLSSVGKYLPQIFDYSTKEYACQTAEKSVACGDILCVMELNPKDKTTLPESADLVLKFHKEKIALYHFVSYNTGCKTHCWVVNKYNEHADSSFASKLRNALFQIHLEAQGLIKSYEFLILNKENDILKKEALVKHIKDIQGRLQKRARFNICPEKIVNIALKATYAIEPQQMQKMLFMVDEIGDKYMTSDFLQLMVPLNMQEWKDGIDVELRKNWNPQTKSDLEYLKDICSANTYKKFIHFITKHNGEIWDIVKSLITDKLKELMKIKKE